MNPMYANTTQLLKYELNNPVGCFGSPVGPAAVPQRSLWRLIVQVEFLSELFHLSAFPTSE